MNLSKNRAQQVVFLLQEADRLLTRRGWCQFAMYGGEDGHSLCLVGALTTASRRVHSDMRLFALGTAIDVLREALALHTSWALPTWNDDPQRSAEDVHLLLKHGVERVEQMAP